MRTPLTGRIPVPRSGGAHHWETGEQMSCSVPQPLYTHIYTGRPLSHRAPAQP